MAANFKGNTAENHGLAVSNLLAVVMIRNGHCTVFANYEWGNEIVSALRKEGKTVGNSKRWTEANMLTPISSHRGELFELRRFKLNSEDHRDRILMVSV